MMKTAMRPISERKIKRGIRDICLGLKSLHSRNVAHLDIKPDNIMISNSNCYKIENLGFAKILAKLGVKSDNKYSAPELFEGNFAHNTTKSDILKHCIS